MKKFKSGSFFLACLGIISAFAACSNRQQSMLIGTWRATELENPQMDSFFSNTRRYIDTIGQSGNAGLNRKLYGTTNMDSLKRILTVQFDSAYQLQMASVGNSIFRFKADSLAVVSFNGNLDSGKWYLENDKTLVIEETNGAQNGVKTKMNIELLTDKKLKLRFEQENVASKVTFIKE